MNFATADLCDQYGDDVRVADPGFRDYGGRRRFAGPVSTVRAFEDNSLVRAALEEPGQGRVLVIDGGNSLRCALVGDKLAALGLDNGWAGIVVAGGIRDAAVIATLDIGVKALGTNPRRSVKNGAGERDVGLRVAGIAISPGEYLYADEDGILVSNEKLVEVL